MDKVYDMLCVKSSLTPILLAAALLPAAALCAAAQPATAPYYAEITGRNGRVLKKVRLDRREEVIDGKRLLLRGGLLRSRDKKHAVVYERAEDAAVEDRALRRSSLTTLFTWYGPDGSAAAAKKFGGRFEPAALSDSGAFLAAVDKCYDDIVVHQRLSPSEARAARELSESRLYVLDRSWRTVYSTSALHGAWDPVLLSPSGTWLIYENITENGGGGANPWRLTAVEVATGRTFRLDWNRDLYYLKPGDDGSVSAARYMGLTQEKFPVKMPGGGIVMQPNAVYVNFVWRPAEGGGFKKAE